MLLDDAPAAAPAPRGTTTTTTVPLNDELGVRDAVLVGVDEGVEDGVTVAVGVGEALSELLRVALPLGVMVDESDDDKVVVDVTEGLCDDEGVGDGVCDSDGVIEPETVVVAVRVAVSESLLEGHADAEPPAIEPLPEALGETLLDCELLGDAVKETVGDALLSLLSESAFVPLAEADALKDTNDTVALPDDSKLAVGRCVPSIE